MKMKKHIISGIIAVFLEEIFRFIINIFKDKLTMDNTILITIPVCLILLMAYWIYLYIESRFDKQDIEIKSLKDKDIAIKSVLKQHNNFISELKYYYENIKNPIQDGDSGHKERISKINLENDYFKN